MGDAEVSRRDEVARAMFMQAQFGGDVGAELWPGERRDEWSARVSRTWHYVTERGPDVFRPTAAMLEGRDESAADRAALMVLRDATMDEVRDAWPAFLAAAEAFNAEQVSALEEAYRAARQRVESEAAALARNRSALAAAVRADPFIAELHDPDRYLLGPYVLQDGQHARVVGRVALESLSPADRERVLAEADAEPELAAAETGDDPILRALRESAEPLGFNALRRASGLPKSTFQRRLGRLVEGGRVERRTDGGYAVGTTFPR